MVKNRFVFIGIACLVAAGAWFAFISLSSPTVKVVHPTTGPAVQAVYATGTVEATVMLPIAARSAARLVELNVDEGAEVAKDQVMARLEDNDLQETLTELEAREQFAHSNYERKATLLKEGAVTRQVYDQSKSDWEAAKAAVARAQAQANFMKLMAPAAGRVIRRDGEIGQLIPANQPVFWISCCAPLRVTAEVDEEDISIVKPGQKVLIRADAFPGKIFNGTVQGITPKGDPVARSYRVRVHFDEETPLLIGMTAETNIIIHERKDALLVPSSAVIQNKVWLVENGNLAERKVEVGARDADQVEITEGLTAEDAVVLTPEESFTAGDPVRARVVKAPSPEKKSARNKRGN